MMRQTLTNSFISIRKRIQASQATVLPSLLYACQTRRLDQIMLRAMQAPYFDSIRKSVIHSGTHNTNNYWNHTISGIRLARLQLCKHKVQDAAGSNLAQQWRWYGHAARLPRDHRLSSFVRYRNSTWDRVFKQWHSTQRRPNTGTPQRTELLVHTCLPSIWGRLAAACAGQRNVDGVRERFHK